MKSLVIAAAVCSLGGLTVGLVAGTMIANHFAANERNAKVQVWLARADIPAGTRIADAGKMFDGKELLKSEVRSDALEDLAELEGAIVIKQVPKGATVGASDLRRKDKTSLEARLSPGTRAVNILILRKGADIAADARVDVLHTPRGSKEPVAMLSNVPVLAVNNLDDHPRLTLVTIEATPAQALELTTAKETGAFTLKPLPAE